MKASSSALFAAALWAVAASAAAQVPAASDPAYIGERPASQPSQPMSGSARYVVPELIDGLQQMQRAPTAPALQACFLLYDLSGGEVRRRGEACKRRFSPGDTFSILQSVAALESGVARVGERVAYDGNDNWAPSNSADQDIGSALQFSSQWYFDRVSRQLGPERQREYLARYQYGNQDIGDGQGRFWDGGPLLISPEEQLAFLRGVFRGDLSLNRGAVDTLRSAMRQPPGVLLTGNGGVQLFGPRRTYRLERQVSAKTATTRSPDGGVAHWAVGEVRNGQRAMVFVSLVSGPNVPESAATDLAQREMQDANAL
jgi:beta-lactamase class D